VAVKDFVALAVIGAVLVAVGLAMWSTALGLVAAGVELIVAAYAGAYIHNEVTKR
jgi:hypothetical protein